MLSFLDAIQELDDPIIVLVHRFFQLDNIVIMKILLSTKCFMLSVGINYNEL